MQCTMKQTEVLDVSYILYLVIQEKAFFNWFWDIAVAIMLTVGTEQKWKKNVKLMSHLLQSVLKLKSKISSTNYGKIHFSFCFFFLFFLFLQFTLQAVLKGNKPDYHLAMGGEQSEAFYQDFLQHMRTVYRADAVKGNGNWFIHRFAN